MTDRLPKGMAESFGKLLLTAAFLQDSYLQLSFYNTCDGMARGLLQMLNKYTPARKEEMDKMMDDLNKNVHHLMNRNDINKHLAIKPLLKGLNRITEIAIVDGIAVIRPEFFQIPALQEETIDPTAESMRGLD